MTCPNCDEQMIGNYCPECGYIVYNRFLLAVPFIIVIGGLYLWLS